MNTSGDEDILEELVEGNDKIVSLKTPLNYFIAQREVIGLAYL